MEYYYVDGFAFSSKEEYNLALREQKNVRSVKTKLNMQDKDSVLEVYQKLASRNLLVTPIGISFLYELRNTLITQFQIDETELSMIRVVDLNEPRNKEEYTNEQLVKIVALKDSQLKSRMICIIGLIIVVVGMFAMTMFFPNTGYATYKKQLEDKYASWDDELHEREQAIIEREEALGIDSQK